MSFLLNVLWLGKQRDGGKSLRNRKKKFFKSMSATWVSDDSILSTEENTEVTPVIAMMLKNPNRKNLPTRWYLYSAWCYRIFARLAQENIYGHCQDSPWWPYSQGCCTWVRYEQGVWMLTSVREPTQQPGLISHWQPRGSHLPLNVKRTERKFSFRSCCGTQDCSTGRWVSPAIPGFDSSLWWENLYFTV